MSHAGMASTSVEVMDDYVRVCTLRRSQIPTVFHSLLRITLFTDRERFLSVTVSASDVTLVAAPEDLAHFDGLGLQQDGTDWRVVRVGEGAEGFEKVGVIERITGPLAAASIPVLYVSTFSSDYVLIPSDRLDEALGLFGHAAAPATEHAPSSSEPDRDSVEPEASVEAVRHSHPVFVLPARTRILQIERRHRHAHTSALIRLLFMPAQARGVPSYRSASQPHGGAAESVGASPMMRNRLCPFRA